MRLKLNFESAITVLGSSLKMQFIFPILTISTTIPISEDKLIHLRLLPIIHTDQDKRRAFVRIIFAFSPKLILGSSVITIPGRNLVSSQGVFDGPSVSCMPNP